MGDPAVVARVDSGAVLLDLRTIEPADDVALCSALAHALTGREDGATGAA
jgi:hypothetical protein